jgi:histone-lysine N-methyltransferase SUV420H
MRHFAIYRQKWPARTPGQLARFLLTPREELTPVDSSPRRITAKTLPVLDRKLSAAAKNPLKSRRRDSPVDEPPAKKRKTETKTKVAMSAKAREVLAGSGRTRSGRHSVPSTKAQESDVKKPVGRPRSKTPPPRTFTPVTKSVPMIKTGSISAPVEPEKAPMRNQLPRPWSRPTKSTVVAHQPRDGHGRFGTKESTNGKFMRKKVARNSANSRAQRALERNKVRSRLDGDDDGPEEQETAEEQDEEVEAPLRSINGRERKRRKDGHLEPRDSPNKKSRLDYDEEPDSISTPYRNSSFGIYQSADKRVGTLGYHRPNPMSFARRSWVSKVDQLEAMLSSETSTADGAASPSTNIESTDTQSWQKSFHRSSNAKDGTGLTAQPPAGALTYKPTPGNFAKRRWASDTWVSSVSRGSSCHSNQSDAEDSPESSDNDDGFAPIDVDIDYSSRFSKYYNTHPRPQIWHNADTDSGEDVSLTKLESPLLNSDASYPGCCSRRARQICSAAQSVLRR